MTALVIGAGLAGCEAAWQLAKRGISVTLTDMKPGKTIPAHHGQDFAELCCSNSLRSDRLENAAGLLKEEMRRLGSLIIEAADATRVPAGGALAVDREGFSRYVTEKIKHHPLITVSEGEITDIPAGNAIIATGPLTSDALAQAISRMPDVKQLSFYDAAAPIVSAASVDMDKAFRQSRYGRGEDYVNLPLNREEYYAFVNALIEAETAPVQGFEESRVFEGCMPVESMAKRGLETLRHGPLKPMGLRDPKTNRMPYAAAQLRLDDSAGTLYNIVGFQTRLKFPEQRRVFGMLPGLENAEFVRYGVMHRNTFLQSPGFLDSSFRVIGSKNLYFAGQITGVEGYVESAASGLTAGRALAHEIMGQACAPFTRKTAIGSLGNYVSAQNRAFQPMNVAFGLMEYTDKASAAQTALQIIDGLVSEENI